MRSQTHHFKAIHAVNVRIIISDIKLDKIYYKFLKQLLFKIRIIN